MRKRESSPFREERPADVDVIEQFEFGRRRADIRDDIDDVERR